MYTKNTAAQVDPYRMVHGLAGLAVGKGARILKIPGLKPLSRRKRGRSWSNAAPGIP